MKKLICLFLSVALMCLPACSTGNENSTYKNNDTDDVDYEVLSFSKEESIQNISIYRNNEFIKKLFEHESQKKCPEGSFYYYTLKTLPEGYEFAFSRQNGYYISTYYMKKDSFEKGVADYDKISPAEGGITFVWAFAGNGQNLLKDTISKCHLTEVPNMPGFYHNGFQIFWEENGYCMQVNIPTELLSIDDKTHTTKGTFDFSVEKITAEFTEN